MMQSIAEERALPGYVRPEAEPENLQIAAFERLAEVSVLPRGDAAVMPRVPSLPRYDEEAWNKSPRMKAWSEERSQ